MSMRNAVAGWLTMVVLVSSAVAEDQTPAQDDQTPAKASQRNSPTDQQQANEDRSDQERLNQQRDTQQRENQQRDNQQRAEEPQAGATREIHSATSKLQESMASCLALGNHAEIELAQAALNKTQTPQVRAFAQEMIKDHQQALDKLKQFMPQINLTAAENGENARGETPPAAQQNHDAQERLQQTIAKNQLAMTKEVLMRYEGQDFDMGYLGEQVIAHIQMLAKLHAMKNQGSQQFQAAVQEMIPTVEEHFKHATRLSRQLQDRDDQQVNTTERNSNVDGNRRELSADPRSQNGTQSQNGQNRPAQAPRETNQQEAGNRQND